MHPKITATDVLAQNKQIPPEQAAEFLGISIRKMEKMRREGDGPRFVRLSHKLVRYRICDLLEFQLAKLRENNAA